MLSAALRILATPALGGAAGFFGGLFGVGGGPIAIPLLGLLYHLDEQIAQGTTLVMVVPNVLLGFWRYRRQGGIDLRIAGALAILAMASPYPAARFATALDPRRLRLAFAAFLVILAAIIASRTRRGSSRQPDRDPLPWGWSVPLGIVGGIVSGLFGVGGALIVPPALTAFFGEGQGLGLALVAPGSVIALVAYAGAGQVDWRLGIPLAVGGVVAISAGVAFAHSLPERRLRFAFCGLLVLIAALLALLMTK